MNDSIISLPSDLKSFGDVVVRENSETVKFIGYSKKEAQLNIHKIKSINENNL